MTLNAQPGPAAPPAPRAAPPRRWTAALALAALAVNVGFFGPLQILLARQAEFIAAGGSKESVLGAVAAVGALCSMLANPLWGALSDRTAGRWGKRLPWVLGGALAGAAGLLLLATAESVAVMVLGWSVVQIALNAEFAALAAAIPDQVPEERRGAVGGWFGLAQTAGVLTGTGLAVGGGAAAGGSVVGGYAACAVFVVLASVPFVLLRRDTHLAAADRPAWNARSFAAGFWPRGFGADFGWAWATRFLMNLGNALSLLYLLYYLKDEVGVADPEGGVLVLTATYAVALLSTVVLGGVWSDRTGRRRVFVTGSGLVMAAAAALMVAWPTWPGAVIAAAVLGLGFGTYTSVDFALVTQVLPAAADRGKDLGVINVANTLPQVLSPVLAAPIVRHLGGYAVLYLVSAGIGLLGAALVYKIKGVR
ncbi:MFS transporter [Actinokineospora bangkokensis]|uniref:MFS transporter n=1 Tax=Actinokineospora bangkokensis TaxID=1193682 RepID=A0A1Q9LPQ0_9PSEU|nr:MFS transporter [Actinokineospora bangkokensis]OLR93981.1 MFS transporter [Actinokineospora bangkokensis]